MLSPTALPGDASSDGPDNPDRPPTVYDHRRQNYDRHAAYAVVAFVTNG